APARERRRDGRVRRRRRIGEYRLRRARLGDVPQQGDDGLRDHLHGDLLDAGLAVVAQRFRASRPPEHRGTGRGEEEIGRQGLHAAQSPDWTDGARARYGRRCDPGAEHANAAGESSGGSVEEATLKNLRSGATKPLPASPRWWNW